MTEAMAAIRNTKHRAAAEYHVPQALERDSG